MKRHSFLSLLLALVLMAGLALPTFAQTSLIITTATTGGTYYPVGVGMASLWTTKLKNEGITVAAQSSAGSAENIEILRNGEAELAILQGLFGKSVYQGIGMYQGRGYKDLRAITMLWPNVEHFLLVEDKVKTGTIADVAGTRFVLGRVGSGTERSTLTIFEGLGYTRDSVRAEYLGYFEAANGIKDRRLDGASIPAGPPVAAVTDLFAAPGIDVRILEVSDEQLEAINEKTAYPGFRYVIPAGTYPGQDEDVRTIAQPNYLAVRSDVDEEVIYKLTKTIFENLEYLHGVHQATKFITLDAALSGLPVPLHPGALRYYREMGIDIPDHLVPPEAM